jgi:hypothetical protein
VIIASEDGQTYPRELWIPGIEQQLAPLPIITSEDAGLDRSLVNKDRNNFAPRIGLAYDLFGNQRTILRAGYGIYYNAASLNAVTLQSQAPPFFKRISATNWVEVSVLASHQFSVFSFQFSVVGVPTTEN